MLLEVGMGSGLNLFLTVIDLILDVVIEEDFVGKVVLANLEAAENVMFADLVGHRFAAEK